MPKRSTTRELLVGARERELVGVISVRVSAADMARLRALGERVPLPPTTIARVAMRVGLEELAKDPARMFAQRIERRGGARKRREGAK